MILSYYLFCRIQIPLEPTAHREAAKAYCPSSMAVHETFRIVSWYIRLPFVFSRKKNREVNRSIFGSSILGSRETDPSFRFLRNCDTRDVAAPPYERATNEVSM